MCVECVCEEERSCGVKRNEKRQERCAMPRRPRLSLHSHRGNLLKARLGKAGPYETST